MCGSRGHGGARSGDRASAPFPPPPTECRGCYSLRPPQPLWGVSLPSTLTCECCWCDSAT
eukprot:13856750-Alexandrium_andersonii.AAC.1